MYWTIPLIITSSGDSPCLQPQVSLLSLYRSSPIQKCKTNKMSIEKLGRIMDATLLAMLNLQLGRREPTIRAATTNGTHSITETQLIQFATSSRVCSRCAPDIRCSTMASTSKPCQSRPIPSIFRAPWVQRQRQVYGVFYVAAGLVRDLIAIASEI